MRIATWNMAYWSKKATHDFAWNYLIDEIKADVALVQEACLQADETFRKKTILTKMGGTRDWGSGVYSVYQSSKEIEFKNSYPGSLIGAEADLRGGKKIAAFSLYGQLETIDSDKTIFATTSVHKMISDLNWVMLGLGKFSGLEDNLIIGGDLNASIQLDHTWQKSKGRYLNAHRLLFERIEDYGLKGVFNFPEKQKTYIQTHRHPRSKTPWQNDYIFLSKNLFNMIRKVEVFDNEEVCRFSDHNPVVVDLDIE